MAATATRQTADQRRDTVLNAAMIEFGLKGLHGASTDDIARRAGISQPYLFRLFRTKRELFLASVERCFRRTEQTFRDAVTGDTPEQRLQSMGMAYCELLADRPKLMMQMQAYAACDDPDVRDTVRRCHGHGRCGRRADPNLVFDRHVPKRDGGHGRAVREGRLDERADGRPDAREAPRSMTHGVFLFRAVCE
jgi:AcrR family transcriptional regulator